MSREHAHGDGKTEGAGWAKRQGRSLRTRCTAAPVSAPIPSLNQVNVLVGADKGGFKQGDRAFSMWWNGGTRQCLDMVVRKGRVERLESIIENNCL